MDRLSLDARAALDALREGLTPNTARIERNWAAIERRARDESDSERGAGSAPPDDERGDALDLPSRRRRLRPLGMTIGLSAIAGACLTLAIVWRSGSLATALHEGEPRSEAAYGVRPVPTLHATAAGTCTPSAVVECTPAPPEAATTVNPELASPLRRPKTPRKTLQPTRRTSSSRGFDEIALLRRARAALRDGNGTAALRALDEHDERFGEGEFGEEATVLRIAALCKIGKTSAGRTLAQRFLATHPRSPLAGQAAHACPSTPAARP